MTELRGGVTIRDEVYGSIQRPVDRLGRPQPRILGAIGILAVGVASGGTPPSEVPSDFWRMDVSEEGFSVAVIACPCGSEPVVEVGCLQSCECERYFYFAIDKVLVFNSPKTRPE